MRLANWRSASGGIASSFSAIRCQDGCDLAAVGVAADNGRAVLAVQYLAQPGDVIGQEDSGNGGAVTL
jgi:hypothetical protein